MMPTQVPRKDKNGKMDRNINLRDVFNNMSIFETEPDIVDEIVRGQIGESAAAWDPAFNEDLVNHLFEEELDLVALNVNRGRDHGLPGYNTYRGICRSGSYDRVNSFPELARENVLSQGDISALKAVYDDIDDIDLFVAGVMEKRHQDALLGPVFTCILGDHFIRLKEGDRFYYENGDVATRFTLPQLDAIRKVSMARM